MQAVCFQWFILNVHWEVDTRDPARSSRVLPLATVVLPDPWMPYSLGDEPKGTCAPNLGALGMLATEEVGRRPSLYGLLHVVSARGYS